MEDREKLEKCIQLAQYYILLFLKDYVDQEKLLEIEELFRRIPVEIKDLNYTDEFGKKSNIGGHAEKDRIIMDIKSINGININNEHELNRLLGMIIHEYVHKIRALNNKYGKMFEEAFASIFAEVCINNAILQNGQNESREQFNMLNSIRYQASESQVRGLLYILKQKGLDISSIVEYVAGDEEKFKQICIQTFGEEFNDYYRSITSMDNKNSEKLLINIIVKYIKENGLNISYYWRTNCGQIEANNLYFQSSDTLAISVANAGRECFKEEEQKHFNTFSYTAKIAKEKKNFVDEEKANKMKKQIEERYSLKNKTIEEIYDTVLYLCSTYIQNKNKDSETSLLFISEIMKFIPYIDDFTNKFINLRVLRIDNRIFDNLDLNKITYNDIYANINQLIEESKNINK